VPEGIRAEDLDRRLRALAERYGLPAAGRAKLECLLERLVGDPLAPTSIRSASVALDDHLADSLVVLEVEVAQDAGAVLDLGAGAGLPGLPLAIALPRNRFTLLESSGRKCAFLERVVRECGVSNATVAQARAESFGEGLGHYDLVTARAVAPLPVTLEYAAPLLRVGGTLVVWRGRRDQLAEAAARRAAKGLGLGEPKIVRVQPYPGATNRYLYLTPKLVETPSGFPRRPGMAAKRPLGSGGPRSASSSDRVQR
jgi:16S rRNA (guanine527-N7)-methyltransferase